MLLHLFGLPIMQNVLSCDTEEVNAWYEDSNLILRLI